jgi:hypothetical protein
MSQTSTETKNTIEKRRAMLRKAYYANPNDERIMPALQLLLTPNYIQEAAKLGIFVSYHRSDEVFALDLTMGLREADANVWLDVTDVIGDDWGSEVQSALMSSGVLLYVLSQDSLESDEMRRDLMHFMTNGKVVVPVMRTLVDTTKLRLDHPIIDFRRDYHYGLEQLIALITPPQQVESRFR